MFGSFWCRLGANLKKTPAIINGQSSSSSLAPKAAKYSHFTETRVTSIFFSTSTTANNNSDSSSFVVSYLIDSCGLSESQAISTSKKINFKTNTKPDSVLTLLKSYGFTELHISKLVNKFPSILSFKPDKTLKPRFDFLISKGIYELDLTNFILKYPNILKQSFDKGIIPSFDFLKSIVHSDQNVITMMKRSYWILSAGHVKRLMVNLELLRNQGVPQTKISVYLIKEPRVFAGDVIRFRKIVEKTKQMGFNPIKITFLVAIHALASMTEVNWRNKMDVYKRWGWSEDHIQAAFRRSPWCMMVSEEKIMAIMNFLVNEMGYDSSSVAECPLILGCSLKARIVPRCSVIKILVSKDLIKEMIPLWSVSRMVDEAFVEKFVSKYEHQVPGLMKIFKGQLNYHQLLQD